MAKVGAGGRMGAEEEGTIGAEVEEELAWAEPDDDAACALEPPALSDDEPPATA